MSKYVSIIPQSQRRKWRSWSREGNLVVQ